MTVFFVLIIVISTLCTILLNSMIAKIGRVESAQRELEFQITNDSQELETARDSYNAAVVKYNESIGRFPCMLVAGIFGFRAINVEQEESL